MTNRPGNVDPFATGAAYPAGANPWNGTPTRVEPGSGDRTTGFVPGTRPPAQWLNWFLGFGSDWDRFHAEIDLRNWFSRTAAFNVAPSGGISALTRVLYDPGDIPFGGSNVAQVLAIGLASGGGTPPAMLSYSGDGWWDASSGITGMNYGNYDGAYVAGDGIDLWIIVGDNKIHTMARDLSAASWSSQTPGDTSNWRGLAHGPGQTHPVVIVGTGGKINTTDDGTTWVHRTSGVATDLLAVCWSAAVGLYVAVGASGVIRTSPDGATWTGRTSGTGASIVGVVYDVRSARFVAITSTGVVKTSPDGVTWSTGGTLAGLGGGTAQSLSIDGLGTVVATVTMGTPGGSPGAATSLAGTAMWFSTDGGASWSLPIQVARDGGTTLTHAAFCELLGWIGAGPIPGSLSTGVIMQSTRLGP